MPVPSHRHSPAPTLEQLEQVRDQTLRRLAHLRVQGPRRALRFLNDVGLASLFATRGLHLPCLWQAVCGRRQPEFPQHSHYDPEVALAWELKDQLPAEGKVFYAKLIRGKPTFVAWDVFPDIYRLFGPRHDYLRQYRDGLLSPVAKTILDALHRKRPQDTLSLKLATNLARPSQRGVFDAGMAEVQRTLHVAMREVRYDPFTYVWDLIEARCPERVAAARQRTPRQAADAVARRYLRAVIYASAQQLRSVLGDRSSLQPTIAHLARDATVRVNAQISGLPGKWLVLSAAAGNSGSPTLSALADD